MKRGVKRAAAWNAVWVFLLILTSVPFALYALDRGLAVADAVEQASARLFHAVDLAASAGIYGHMIAGALAMVLAPVQLLGFVRSRLPALHRMAGYALAVLATLTALGGIAYIARQGSIGGPVMSVGFTLYGLLMLLSVVQTVRYAVRRDPRHRLWAERLVILVMASWLYRVHYGLWEILTGGVGSNADFTGPFDRVQVFAFYLPYLAVHAWCWQHRTTARAKLA